MKQVIPKPRVGGLRLEPSHPCLHLLCEPRREKTVLMVWPRPLVRFRPSIVDLRIGSLAFLLCFFFPHATNHLVEQF